MIEHLLELVHGMPPDLADTLLTLRGVPAEQRAIVLAVTSAVGSDAPAPERYELERILSDDGATADVWLARDRLLERHVAIKLFRDPDRDYAAVIAEARAVAKLASDHIVAIHDITHLDGRVAIVMEHITSAAPPTSLRAQVELVIQVAHGIAAAHAQSVFHLDLKPANVLFDGRAHVADFGLARLFADRGDDAFVGIRGAPSARKIIAGSIPWMAPEQAAGLPYPLESIRHANSLTRIDVHGLGALAYGLFTGRAPHTFTTESRVQRLAEVASGAALVDIAAAAKTTSRPLPHRLAAIIRRALSHDPELRPRTALAFARELEAWLAKRPRKIAFAIAATVLVAVSAALIGQSGDPTSSVTPPAIAAATSTPQTTPTRATPPTRATRGPAPNAELTPEPTQDPAPTPTHEPTHATAPTREPTTLRKPTPAHTATRGSRLTVSLPAHAPDAAPTRPFYADPTVLFTNVRRSGRIVVDPAEGTLEHALVRLFEIGRMDDAKAGFEALEPLLHSDIRASLTRLGAHEAYNFPAFRRRVPRLVPDVDPIAFVVAYTDGDPAHDEYVKIFVAYLDDSYSVMPRPFQFKRDPSAENDYRLLSY